MVWMVIINAVIGVRLVSLVAVLISATGIVPVIEMSFAIGFLFSLEVSASMYEWSVRARVSSCRKRRKDAENAFVGARESCQNKKVHLLPLVPVQNVVRMYFSMSSISLYEHEQVFCAARSKSK